MLPDITTLTDDELDQLRDLVFAEQDKRATVASAGERIDEIVRAVNEAEGVEDGEPWVERPYGYPKGARVTQEGVTYVSQIPNNVWRPGDTSNPVSGALWEPETTPVEGVQPWAAWEDVAVGDLRTHDGIEYRVRQAHKTLPGWEPPNTPALWERTTP